MTTNYLPLGYFLLRNNPQISPLSAVILDNFIFLGVPKMISKLSRKIQKFIYSPENGENDFSRFFENRIPRHSLERYFIFKIVLNDFVTALQLLYIYKYLLVYSGMSIFNSPYTFFLCCVLNTTIIALRQMQVRIVTDEDVRVYPILRGNIFNFHRIDYSILN